MHSTRMGTRWAINSPARRRLLAGMLGLALVVGWGSVWMARALAGPEGTLPIIITDLAQVAPVLRSIHRVLEDPGSAAVIDDLIQTSSLFHIGTASIGNGADRYSHSLFFRGKNGKSGRFLIARFRTEWDGTRVQVAPPEYYYATFQFPDPVHALATGPEELRILKTLVRDPKMPAFLDQLFGGTRIDYICVAQMPESQSFQITLMYEERDPSIFREELVQAVPTADGYEIRYE